MLVGVGGTGRGVGGEREREGETEREGGREGGRERVCVQLQIRLTPSVRLAISSSFSSGLRIQARMS